MFLAFHSGLGIILERHSILGWTLFWNTIPFDCFTIVLFYSCIVLPWCCLFFHEYTGLRFYGFTGVRLYGFYCFTVVLFYCVFTVLPFYGVTVLLCVYGCTVLRFYRFYSFTVLLRSVFYGFTGVRFYCFTVLLVLLVYGSRKCHKSTHTLNINGHARRPKTALATMKIEGFLNENLPL